METILHTARASPLPPPSFLRSAISPRPFTPSRVSIPRIRSHNYNLIKPKIRERRSKQRWRWEEEEEEQQQQQLQEGHDQGTASEEDDAMSDEDLAEEMEVLEKEAMEGPHEGRDPSDYDRRAHIFHRSSRVFKVLKEKNDNNATGTAGHK